MSTTDPDKKQQEINYYKKQLKEMGSSAIGLQYKIAEMSRESQQMRKGFELISDLQNISHEITGLNYILDQITEEINVRMQMDISMILVIEEIEGIGNSFKPLFIKAYSLYDTQKAERKRITFPNEFLKEKRSLLVNSKTTESTLINMLKEELNINYFILTPVIYEQKAVAFIFSGCNTEGLVGSIILTHHHQNAFEAIAGVISTFKGQIDKNILLEKKVEERTLLLQKEMDKSEQLLLNILPKKIADELKATGTAKAVGFDLVTVMFTDFKNFTAMSELLNAQELVNEIDYCYRAFDNIITRHGIEKIKTIGDSYMCAGGLPAANNTHALDIVKAAVEIRDFMVAEKAKRQTAGRPFFEIRIGCNTGPIVAGIVGIKKFAYDIWGDTVNIASRMESSGEPGKVNISGSTYEFVKDQIPCIYRGKIEAKNKGQIDMYFVK